MIDCISKTVINWFSPICVLETLNEMNIEILCDMRIIMTISNMIISNIDIN